MTISVIMTGNHYLLDAVAGSMVVLVSLMLSTLWSSWTLAHTAQSAAAPAPVTASRQ